MHRILLILAALSLLTGCSSDTSPGGPSPKLSPGEVVEIVMDALKANDTPSPDAGVATAFAFASPGNKAVTGPLERFARMVKGPGYGEMIGYRGATYGEVDFAEAPDGTAVAKRRVTIETHGGELVSYVFILSKQRGGDFDNCWMTDGVVRVNAPESRPAGENGPRGPAA